VSSTCVPSGSDKVEELDNVTVMPLSPSKVTKKESVEPMAECWAGDGALKFIGYATDKSSTVTAQKVLKDSDRSTMKFSFPLKNLPENVNLDTLSNEVTFLFQTGRDRVDKETNEPFIQWLAKLKVMPFSKQNFDWLGSYKDFVTPAISKMVRSANLASSQEIKIGADNVVLMNIDLEYLDSVIKSGIDMVESWWVKKMFGGMKKSEKARVKCMYGDIVLQEIEMRMYNVSNWGEEELNTEIEVQKQENSVKKDKPVSTMLHL